MVRRHARASFGDTYVFPGGVLERGDHKVGPRCCGLADDDASRTLDVDAGGLSFYSAAIRELFEETGILLADTGADADELAVARDGLNDETLHWESFVSRNDVRLYCDELVYFSYWITPRIFPKRYSTRFFMAEAPANQQASHCGGEVTELRWMTARAALDAADGGSISLSPPTRATLESIVEHATADSLLAWARQRERDGVPCVFPEIREDADGRPVVVDRGSVIGRLT